MSEIKLRSCPFCEGEATNMGEDVPTALLVAKENIDVLRNKNRGV